MECYLPGFEPIKIKTHRGYDVLIDKITAAV